MVTKQTLAEALYTYLNTRGKKVSRDLATEAVAEVLATIEMNLAAGGEVKLHNIGTLRTVYPTRTTKTNLPGSKGEVCAFRPTVKFKPSNVLRRHIRPAEEG